MNKGLFKNIGFAVIIFGLISFAFLADAKSSNNSEKREKIIKEVIKVKKLKNSDSDDEKRGDKTIKEKIIKAESKIKKSEKFEVKGIVKSVDKDMKTLTVLINKTGGKLLREKKGQEEKFSVGSTTEMRLKDISLNFEELMAGMAVQLKGRKTNGELSLNKIEVRIKTIEIQGELKSIDVASRTVKVLVKKAKHIKSVVDKETDIKVFANAKIIKADERKTLDSLAAGDSVNLKIIKIGDNIFVLKIAVKEPKAEEEAEEIKTAAISITNDGFTPNSLEVSKGTKVIWTNNASSSVQVASDPHPVHTNFPDSEFSAGPILQPNQPTGQGFEFTFNKEMTFKYHDHLNASSTGTVIVK